MQSTESEGMDAGIIVAIISGELVGSSIHQECI